MNNDEEMARDIINLFLVEYTQLCLIMTQEMEAHFISVICEYFKAVRNNATSKIKC